MMISLKSDVIWKGIYKHGFTGKQLPVNPCNIDSRNQTGFISP